MTPACFYAKKRSSLRHRGIPSSSGCSDRCQCLAEHACTETHQCKATTSLAKDHLFHPLLSIRPKRRKDKIKCCCDVAVVLGS
eukprot:4840531-Amphidinium_carterae.1